MSVSCCACRDTLPYLPKSELCSHSLAIAEFQLASMTLRGLQRVQEQAASAGMAHAFAPTPTTAMLSAVPWPCKASCCVAMSEDQHRRAVRHLMLEDTNNNMDCRGAPVGRAAFSLHEHQAALPHMQT